GDRAGRGRGPGRRRGPGPRRRGGELMTQLEIDVPGADVPGTAPETDGLDGLGDPGSGTPGTGHHPESQGADREHLGQMRLSRLQLHNWGTLDRKSTRLNSSHVSISYAVFCL